MRFCCRSAVSPKHLSEPESSALVSVLEKTFETLGKARKRL